MTIREIRADNKTKRDVLYNELISHVNGNQLPTSEKVFCLRLVIKKISEGNNGG